MRGIAGEKQPPIPHRLDDEAAHRDDAFLEDASLGELPALARLEAGVQLFPDACVRPVLHLVVRIALQVEALDLRRARADEGEATIMHGIDELVGGWRCFHQDAEPAEGIYARELAAHARGNRGSRDAVEAIAAGDEIAGDFNKRILVVKADL